MRARIAAPVSPASGSETDGSIDPSIRFSVNSERSRLAKSMPSISATVRPRQLPQPTPSWDRPCSCRMRPSLEPNTHHARDRRMQMPKKVRLEQYFPR